MENTAQSQDDLNFIKHVVAQRQKNAEGPPAIYLLWGVITLAGYPILDWRPEFEGLYWLVMGPVGGALSLYLGRRFAAARGEDSRSEGMRWLWHWLCVTAAIGLMALMVVNKQLAPSGIGPAILLVVTLGMALAAVHSRSLLIWNALILAAGYVAIFFISSYVWTLIGAAFFLGSLMNFILARRANARTE